MSEAARTFMTVTEFLAWTPAGDRRYELVDGIPRAMATPDPEHQIVQSNLNGLLYSTLRDHPTCTARAGGSVLLPNNDHNWYEPDLVVTCVPHVRGQTATVDPVLIVEILSPSTERHDRSRKLPNYHSIPSVQEILLIEPRYPYCELHRRLDAERWLVVVLQTLTQTLVLESIGASVPLAELYRKVDLEPDEGETVTRA